MGGGVFSGGEFSKVIRCLNWAWVGWEGEPIGSCMSALKSSNPKLIECYECGYLIEDRFSQLCPECGTDWPERARVAKALRASIESAFVMQMKKAVVFWIGVVLLYAAGAEIAGNEYSGVFAFYAIFSIGILVGASLLLGLVICDFGPAEDRVVNVSMWIRFMPVLHAPWLMIAPITMFGSAVSLVLGRTGLSESKTMDIMMVVVYVVVLHWIGASLVLAIRWGKLYMRERERLCMYSTRRAYQMHSLLGALIWIGAFVLGAIGGVLGLMLVGFLLGDPQEVIIW